MKKIILMLVISMFTGRLYASNGINPTKFIGNVVYCVQITAYDPGTGKNCAGNDVPVMGEGSSTACNENYQTAADLAASQAAAKAKRNKELKIAALIFEDCPPTPQP